MGIGRIRRRTYVIINLIMIVFGLFYSYISAFESEEQIIFLIVYIIVTLIISMYLNIGRLHDINLSGWYALLAFIPLINLGFLALYIMDGTKGLNKYGLDPKGRTKSERKTQVNVVSKEENQNKLKDIERKIDLLDDGYKNGILTENEYSEKKEALKFEKNKIGRNSDLRNEVNSKLTKLQGLLDDKIISQKEYDDKKFSILSELGTDIADITMETPIFYISEGKEYGPYNASFIIHWMRKGDLNEYCQIRTIEELYYTKRAHELYKLEA